MGLDLETKLEAVIESISDGVYMTDSQGVCIACNTAFKRITGLTTDILGKHVTYLLDHNLITEVVTPQVISSLNHIFKIITYPSGCEALVTGNPVMDPNNKLIAVVCVVRDLSELNSLRSELVKSKQLNRQYHEILKKLTPSVDSPISKVVVRDPLMKKIIDLIPRIADSDATVMIYGESGVGKGVIANLIHEQSNRFKNGRFVKVDCGAIPSSLLESELFGYEQGAFTGARREGKKGLFEMAHQGTLFLDEIGELPLLMQVKLLNVLQDRCILRIGGTESIPIDVRIICATNRNLEKMVTEGSFREDLYYRINVIPITVMPLRERNEDIIILTVSFLAKFNHKYKRTITISPEVITCFLEYNWPGNVRELENTVEQLVVLLQKDLIRLDDLPEKIKKCADARQNEFHFGSEKTVPLKIAVANTERMLIRQALKQHEKLSLSAQALDIDISTLLRKCKKYGIKRENFS